MASLLASSANAGAVTGTPSTTCSVTVPATTSGSFLFLIIGASSASVSSISMGGGTWTQQGNSPNNHNFCKIYKGSGVAPGTTTGTITFASATNSAVQSQEWDGLVDGVADTTATGSGNSTAPSAGPVTPSTADNIVIGAFADAVAETAGPSGGFTGLTGNVFVSTRRIVSGYKIQSSASAATIGYTLGSTAFWDGVVVTFKVAASAPTGTLASAFGFASDSSGVVGASGILASAFQFASDSQGVVSALGIADSAFGFALAGTGVMTTSAVTGTGASAFGFGISGVGFQNITAQSTIYGPAFNMDTKNNGRVGPDMSALSYRFRSPTSSTTTGVVWQRRFGGVGAGNYSGGNGGTMRIGIQADDGTAAHAPTGVYLGFTDYTPGAQPTGNKGIYTALPSISLNANTLYHFVFTNVDGSPSTNFFSVNNAYIFGPALTPRQPAFADVDLAVLYKSGAWSTQPKDTPDFDLVMADGRHLGSRYMASNHDAGTFGTISGPNNMVRERFTVTGGPITVRKAWYRPSKSAGSAGPLTFRLEDSSGTLIEQGNVTASGVVSWSSGQDSQTGSWISYTFATPRVLANGLEYRLRLSTDAASTYYSVIMLTQDSNDDPAHHMLSRGFTDGVTEKTTNGGGAWSAVYSGFPNNGQWYFEVDTGPGTILGVGNPVFGWSVAGVGTATQTFTGSGGSAFGWNDVATGVAGSSGTGGSAFGWTDLAFGAAGGVSGSGGVAFGWSTLGVGASVASGVFGAGASAFGWESVLFGGMERRQDPRILEMMFPGPKGVWFQPPRP